MGQPEDKPTPKNTTRQPPRAPPVPPSLPPGVDPRAVMTNLQQLGKNPQAVAALRDIFGGGGGQEALAPAIGPMSSGPMGGGPMEVLFASIANCVNSITKSSDRTNDDLIAEREKTAKLEAQLEVSKKREENERVAKLAGDLTKQQFSSVIAGALQIANKQGGNKQLSEAMICLAQITGIELKPEHIDALNGTSPTDPGPKAK